MGFRWKKVRTRRCRHPTDPHLPRSVAISTISGSAAGRWTRPLHTSPEGFGDSGPHRPRGSPHGRTRRVARQLPLPPRSGERTSCRVGLTCIRQTQSDTVGSAVHRLRIRCPPCTPTPRSTPCRFFGGEEHARPLFSATPSILLHDVDSPFRRFTNGRTPR